MTEVLIPTVTADEWLQQPEASAKAMGAQSDHAMAYQPSPLLVGLVSSVVALAAKGGADKLVAMLPGPARTIGQLALCLLRRRKRPSPPEYRPHTAQHGAPTEDK